MLSTSPYIRIASLPHLRPQYIIGSLNILSKRPSHKTANNNFYLVFHYEKCTSARNDKNGINAATDNFLVVY
jgi:hypothetical protein